MLVFCPVRDKTNLGIDMFYRPVFPTGNFKQSLIRINLRFGKIGWILGSIK
jgi:hypothetical protein